MSPQKYAPPAKHPRPQLAVGSLVMATKNTGVCSENETGVVYEVYNRDATDGQGEYGFSIIFAGGRYDGWSWGDIAVGIVDLKAMDSSLVGYEFTNVIRLTADFHAGRFNQAFEKADQLVLKELKA